MGEKEAERLDRRDFVGPEIGAERAEEKRYEAAKKKREVIAGVRDRIDTQK